MENCTLATVVVSITVALALLVASVRIATRQILAYLKARDYRDRSESSMLSELAGIITDDALSPEDIALKKAKWFARAQRFAGSAGP